MARATLSGVGPAREGRRVEEKVKSAKRGNEVTQLQDNRKQEVTRLLPGGLSGDDSEARQRPNEGHPLLPSAEVTHPLTPSASAHHFCSRDTPLDKLR